MKTVDKKVDGKRKVGRPTKWKDENISLATKFSRLGATNEILAKCFEVSIFTIDEWLRKKPEFSSAVKKGRIESDAKVAERLYNRACGYHHLETVVTSHNGEITKTDITKHYPPDTAAAFIWLKNRRPDIWRDKPAQNDDEQAQPVSVNIVIQDASKKKQ